MVVGACVPMWRVLLCWCWYSSTLIYTILYLPNNSLGNSSRWQAASALYIWVHNVKGLPIIIIIILISSPACGPSNAIKLLYYSFNVLINVSAMLDPYAAEEVRSILQKYEQ